MRSIQPNRCGTQCGDRVHRCRSRPSRAARGLAPEERIEFNVETIYKGDAPSRWSVSVNATDCGYVFSDGERYTVFVTADGKTNLCMGNVRGAIDPTTYGVEPITVYSSSQLIDLGRTADRIALAALLLVGLAALTLVRIRRSRNA